MTVGILAGGSQSALPSLGECDLVIHVCPESTDPGAMPDGAQAAGGAACEAAPLLVLGGPAEATGACVAIAEPGPEGILLRAAVARCLAHARRMRGGPVDSRQEHSQFLGHELRTPLAAIKTALDVLVREDGLDGAAGRMLDIAARNVDRLTGTVEWSQDLIECGEAPPVAHLEDVSLTEVVRRLKEAGWKVSAPGDPSQAVLTDPGLLVQLVGQLGRVMQSVYPDQECTVTLEAMPKDDNIRLAILTAGVDRPVGGLQQGHPAGRGEATLEKADPIQRLIEVMTAPYLREVLGVQPCALGTDAGLRGVGFDLPLPLYVPTS